VVRPTERVFTLPPHAVLSLEQRPDLLLAADARQGVRDTVSFDTEDLRLTRAGISLWRGLGDQPDGWRLRLPADVQAGGELHLPVADQQVERSVDARADQIMRPDTAVLMPIPSEFTDLLGAHTRGRPLLPAVLVSSLRSVWSVTTPSGQALAHIALDHVLARRLLGEPAAMTWTSAAVRPSDGERAHLDALEHLLVAQGARRAGVSHGLDALFADRLSALRRPERAAVKRDRAAAAVLAYLRAQRAALLASDLRVRLDQPDAVHQMRVAARRARSALQHADGVLDRGRCRVLARELKWLGAALGAARDQEIVTARLRTRLDELPAQLVAGPVRARVTERLAVDHQAAREAMLACLNSTRYLDLLNKLDALLTDPPLGKRGHTSAAKELPRLLHRARRRFDRAVDAIGTASDRDAAIHRARKAAKRARYTAELAQPALGKPRAQAGRSRSAPAEAAGRAPRQRDVPSGPAAPCRPGPGGRRGHVHLRPAPRARSLPGRPDRTPDAHDRLMQSAASRAGL
jgi:CHAD domain-containing protein